MTKKTKKFFAVKGMNDILPNKVMQWRYVEEAFEKLVENYGYHEIRTPVIENTNLFKRSVGIASDIVEKEMYSFVDSLNNEELSLRPENTASVVRAVIEHDLLYDGPKRLWYRGPMFRHERPQRGRYRQFHQMGVEALGFPGSEVDAELILMCANFWKQLKIESTVKLELNCLGSPDERAKHRHALLSYFADNYNIIELDDVAKARLAINPLRILDSKREILQPMLSAAPSILEFLSQKSLDHFEQLKLILNENNITFTINPRLVRGLDYYNLTVFEWITDSLGAQGTVAAGGRYDILMNQLGGRMSSGCGLAIGIERLLDLLTMSNCNFASSRKLLFYIVYDEAQRLPLAVRLAELLRDNNLSAVVYSSSDSDTNLSLKKEFKYADRSGAQYVLVLGEREEQTQSVTVKCMHIAKDDKGFKQSNIPMAQIVVYLKNIVSDVACL